jgi:tetratricopeptide (TPR) repeat protein
MDINLPRDHHARSSRRIAMRKQWVVLGLGLLVISITWGIPVRGVYAQSKKEAIVAYNRGIKFYEQGQYLEALAEMETALRLYRQLQGDESENVADCYNTLGNVHSDMGQYAKAEPLYRRSLEIREAKLGKDHPDTAQSLNNLAILYRGMGEYAKAEPLYCRSLDIRESKRGKDRPTLRSCVRRARHRVRSRKWSVCRAPLSKPRLFG